MCIRYNHRKDISMKNDTVNAIFITEHYAKYDI